MSLSFYLYIEVDTGGPKLHTVNLHGVGITNNLIEMAQASGLYNCFWQPAMHNYIKAGDLIGQLRLGLESLRAHPKYFRKLEASNGWGTYDQFVDKVRQVLEAAEAHPNALIYTHK